MVEREVFAHKIVNPFAVILEAMELRKHKQTFHYHSQQFRFREPEVVKTRKTCTDT